LALAAPAAIAQEEASEAQSILQGLVEDFMEDPFSKDFELTVGVQIKDVGEWYLEIAGSKAIKLKPGPLTVPAPYYITDMETLRRIDSGELGILTAMGRAKMTDPAPVDFGFANDYELTPDAMATLMPFTFHFWTKGQPEIVSFGELDQARVVHGAYATLFYYEKGLRSGYYRVEKDQHINADPTDQVNPFPTLFIFIGGALDSRIGGKEISIEGKQTILVPAGVAHEFWNPNDEPAEFIIIMFGEGA
jgi:mannose-6-phosphate isomerase-like protein (cupin superfamily)